MAKRRIDDDTDNGGHPRWIGGCAAAGACLVLALAGVVVGLVEVARWIA